MLHGRTRVESAGIRPEVWGLGQTEPGPSPPQVASDAEEIQAAADAMVRLLIGIPMRSDGQLTIKSLASELG